jgi:poly(hydroxyalkanoate) depolymerase family esterase
MRDMGEPSIIAGITREIISEYNLDRRHVFVAGLSAGGAMATVMGETYPDVFSAVGVHSGLAYKAANDVISAFAAMRGDTGLPIRAKPQARKERQSEMRTIVFQGSADQTVHPSNARSIVDAASRHHGCAVPNLEQRSTAGGRIYTRSIIAGQGGVPAVEYWLIHGAGHAWSGGRREGSYTDPDGPDASAEMMRFFLCP